MDGSSFQLRVEGIDYDAFLFRKGGNGSVYSMTNGHGVRMALKLVSARRFNFVVGGRLSQKMKARIEGAFSWAHNIWFK